MFDFTQHITLKKVLSLSIAVLFTLNSISFAQPLSSNTLREASTAVSVPNKDIASSLQNAAKPRLDNKGLFGDMQDIKRSLDDYKEASRKAYEEVLNASGYNPDLWSTLRQADKEYQDAVVAKLITISDKSSSAGVTVEANEVPEIFAHLDIEEGEAMFSRLEIGLRDGYVYNRFSTAIRLLFLGSVNKDISVRYKDEAFSLLKDNINNSSMISDKYDKLFLAIGLALLGNSYNEILSDSMDIIHPILKDYRSDHNAYYSILSVIALAILDKVDPDTLSDYKDSVIPMLEDDIKNGDTDNKLMAAVALAAFICIDDGILSDYKDTVLSILRDGLTDGDQYDNFLAVIGLVALTKKGESLYRIVVSYSDEKLLTILGKDAYKLAEKLNRDILDNLGISCKALSNEELELYSPALHETIIVDIDQKGSLEQALLRFITAAVSTLAPAKASSAGINVEVNKRELNMIKERITFLMGKEGVGNTGSLARTRAREALSRYDREIVTPRIGERLSINAQRFKEDMESAYSAAISILEESFQPWNAFYQAQEKYYNAVIESIDGMIAAEDIAAIPDESLPADDLDIGAILELRLIQQTMAHLLGKRGFGSIDPLRRIDAASYLSDLNIRITELGIDKELSPEEKGFKDHIEKDMAWFITANRSDDISFPLEEYDRSIYGYYNAVIEIINGMIVGAEDLVSNPRSSSAGDLSRREVSRLEMDNIIDETMAFLISAEALGSTDRKVREEARDAISEFDEETIERYIRISKIVHMFKRNLRNANPWKRAYAVARMSKFDKDGIVEPYIKDTIDFLNSRDAFGSTIPSEKLRAAAIFSIFDKDTLAEYMDAENIIQFLASREGFGSSYPSVREYTAQLLCNFGEDAIAEFVNTQRITTVLVKNLESTDLWERARAVAALRNLVGKENFPVIFKVVVQHPGSEELLTTLVKDAYELAEILNRDIHLSSGRHFIALSDYEVKLTDPPQDNLILFETKVSTENQTLAHIIPDEYQSLIGKDGLDSVDASKRLRAAVKLCVFVKKIYLPHINRMLAILIEKEGEGLNSLDIYERLGTAAALSRLDKVIIEPHTDRIISILEAGLNHPALQIRFYVAKALSRFDKNLFEKPDTAERVDTLMRLEKPNGTIAPSTGKQPAGLQIIEKKYLSVTNPAKSASRDTIRFVVRRMNEAIRHFTNIKPRKTDALALEQFKGEMKQAASSFKRFGSHPSNAYSASIDSIRSVDTIEWILEQSKKATDALCDFDKIMPEEYADQKLPITIIVDQNDIPEDQLLLMRLFSKGTKGNPYRQELIKRLGVNIVLASEFKSSEDWAKHMIIISKTRIEVKGAETAHYLNLQSEMNDDEAFMQLPLAIVFAKGLILYAMTENPDIRAELELRLESFYKTITSGKSPWSRQMLEAFLKANGQFTLSLPAPAPMDMYYIYTYQRIYMQALIAA